MLKILKTIFNTTIQVYYQSTKLKQSASLLQFGNTPEKTPLVKFLQKVHCCLST